MGSDVVSTDGNKYNVTMILLIETIKTATEITDIVEVEIGMDRSEASLTHYINDRQHEKPPQVLLNSLITLWW